MAIGALLGKLFKPVADKIIKPVANKILKPLGSKVVDPLLRKLGFSSAKAAGRSLKKLGGKAIGEGVEAGAEIGLKKLLKMGAEEGTAYVASGGFLSPAEQRQLGRFADSARGNIERAREFRRNAQMFRSRAIALAEG